jgi:hypothetical protein
MIIAEFAETAAGAAGAAAAAFTAICSKVMSIIYRIKDFIFGSGEPDRFYSQGPKVTMETPSYFSGPPIIEEKHSMLSELSNDTQPLTKKQMIKQLSHEGEEYKDGWQLVDLEDIPDTDLEYLISGDVEQAKKELLLNGCPSKSLNRLTDSEIRSLNRLSDPKNMSLGACREFHYWKYQLSLTSLLEAKKQLVTETVLEAKKQLATETVFEAKKQLATKTFSATVLQKMVRGKLGRKRAIQTKAIQTKDRQKIEEARARLEGIIKVKKFKSATVIQRMFRGMLGRKRARQVSVEDSNNNKVLAACQHFDIGAKNGNNSKNIIMRYAAQIFPQEGQQGDEWPSQSDGNNDASTLEDSTSSSCPVPTITVEQFLANGIEVTEKKASIITNIAEKFVAGCEGIGAKAKQGLANGCERLSSRVPMTVGEKTPTAESAKKKVQENLENLRSLARKTGATVGSGFARALKDARAFVTPEKKPLINADKLE